MVISDSKSDTGGHLGILLGLGLRVPDGRTVVGSNIKGETLFAKYHIPSGPAH